MIMVESSICMYRAEKTGLSVPKTQVNLQNKENYVTNKEGFVILKGENKYYSENTLLIKEKDSLATEVRFSKKHRRSSSNVGNIKSHILTDRSIYQTRTASLL